MSNRMSRRSMITKTAGVTAGAVIPVVLTSSEVGAEPGAEVNRTMSRIAEVRSHVGDKVTVASAATPSGAASQTVTLPMAGFPSGWRLDEHDQVVVTRPDAAIYPSTVMPLVVRLEGQIDKVSGPTVSIAGKAVRLREESLQTWAAASANVKYEAYVIPNDSKSVLSCVTLRPTS